MTPPSLLSCLLYWSLISMKESPPIPVDPFGLPQQGIPTLSPRFHAPKRRGLFLKGPVPLEWLATAAGCGGKALAVAVLLWHRRGVTGSADVSLSRPLRDRFGISASTFRRAVLALERVKLVAVTRSPGCSHRLVILDEPGDSDSPANPSGSESGLG